MNYFSHKRTDDKELETVSHAKNKKKQIANSYKLYLLLFDIDSFFSMSTYKQSKQKFLNTTFKWYHDVGFFLNLQKSGQLTEHQDKKNKKILTWLGIKISSFFGKDLKIIKIK